MDLPHRRVADGDALDQNVSAAIRLNEVRPQIRTFAENSFADGSPLRPEFDQPLSCRSLGVAPTPPMRLVRLAVDCSRTGDGEVPLFKCINERRIVHQLGTFPARKHNWKVSARIGNELENRSFSEMQIHATLQAYRCRQEFALRNDKASASRIVTSRDCL